MKKESNLDFVKNLRFGLLRIVFFYRACHVFCSQKFDTVNIFCFLIEKYVCETERLQINKKNLKFIPQRASPKRSKIYSDTYLY